jgi:hypothetical protein
MADQPELSVAAARRAAADDDLDAWMADFLASPGSDNAELADILRDRELWWLGPLLLPIDRLHRLAGPPGHPVLTEVDESWWRDDVEDLGRRIADGWEPPPLVVTYRQRQLVVEDGNHRIEAIRQAGRADAWAIVGFADRAERDRYATSSLADGGQALVDAAT